jgi:hypothetical protein
MIPIIAYFDGDNINNAHTGIEYSISPRLIIFDNENLTFEEIKRALYQGLQVVEFRYSIDIQCRFNMAHVGYFFFNVMPVYDKSYWRITYYTVCAKMRMIELYVKLHPLQSDKNDDLFACSQSDSSSSSTPPQRSYNVNTLSRPDVQAFIGNVSNQEEKINFDPIPTDNEDEDDEDYNGSEDEDEDGEDDEDIDDDDDDEYIRPVISQVDQYNPFIGHGLVHPASSFHDSSSWVPADHILYKNKLPTEDPLVKNQTFESKEHLNIAISSWHIEKNREIIVKDSNK